MQSPRFKSYKYVQVQPFKSLAPNLKKKIGDWIFGSEVVINVRCTPDFTFFLPIIMTMTNVSSVSPFYHQVHHHDSLASSQK